MTYSAHALKANSPTKSPEADTPDTGNGTTNGTNAENDPLILENDGYFLAT